MAAINDTLEYDIIQNGQEIQKMLKEKEILFKGMVMGLEDMGEKCC